MDFGLRVFYGVVYGSLVWFCYVGLTMGILVSLGLRYRLLWFGRVRKWKWSMLTGKGMPA